MMLLQLYIEPYTKLTLLSQNISSTVNVKKCHLDQNINIFLQMERFCITETKNYFNLYLATLFENC